MSDSAAILGEYNVYGSSGAVSALADHLHQKAHLVVVLHDELLGKAKPSTWQGKASGAFADALGDLPMEMSKLFRSYGEAERALHHYAHHLHHHKLRAHELADKIAHANRVIGDAQDAKVKAQVDYDSAKGIRDSSLSYPESVTTAIKDMARAKTALNDAHTSIVHWEGVRSAAFAAAKENRATFVERAHDCCGRLDAASRHGIQNRTYSGVDKVVDGLESVVGFVWNGLGDILDELGDVLDIGTIFAGLLVVAAGIATILSDGAAAPLLEGSLEILDGAVTAKIAADVGAVATGKKDSSVLLEDAISVIGGKGASKAIEKAFPAGTHDEVKNALEAAARVPKGEKPTPQQLYAQHLHDVFMGKAAATTAYKGAKLSHALQTKLEGLLAQACGKHSGHS